MSTPHIANNLKEEYREIAAAHGIATLNGDYKAANSQYERLVALVPRIRSCGSSGEEALFELTNDNNDAVVCWAATHSLSFDPARALSALEQLSQKKGPIGFDATMVVQEWKKGSLVLP